MFSLLARFPRNVRRISLANSIIDYEYRYFGENRQ